MTYKYYTAHNQVICVAPFDGHNIRTTAKCHPDDLFDEDKGRELAKLRMDEKVLNLRLRDLHEEIDGLNAMIDHLVKQRDSRVAKETQLHNEKELARVRREAAEESM